ncbi:unnamed protein product [Dibothriocephalus latus]|uniref:Uncharacterized protein n=1 Tax=Dibothriocephalus latus TaxID=60516 RepID=A0A3P6U0K6_DIBLA|nr:unnamed protein product [Dibothriocephalus latus]
MFTLRLNTFGLNSYPCPLSHFRDTAGQERYRSLTTSSFRDARAFIIVYDLTHLETFTRIRETWLPLTDTRPFPTKQNSKEPVPVFLVGNKSDLARLREVPMVDVQKLSRQQYAHGVFETSARTGNNVNALFQAVAESMLSTWGVPKASSPVVPFNDFIRAAAGLSRLSSLLNSRLFQNYLMTICALELNDQVNPRQIKDLPKLGLGFD